MKEVKNNKKPFIFYYTIVIVIMILLNMFVFPKVLSPTVKEVGYDTFLTMLDKKEIQQVQVEDNQIIFSDNADPVNYYKTGVFNDPDLVNRLQDAGVEFGTEIVEEASPWMSLLVSMVPFIIMIVIGQMLMKNLNKKMGGMMGGNDEREQTLNQLLTEMDGFEDNTGVIILAATNRPDSLDPALTRPGRFDRRVPVELPDLKGREAILRVHAKKIKVAGDVDFGKIARMASGASGAELANIINEAALRAVRAGRHSATQADLEESIEVVIAGYQKKNAILTDEEKRIVAYHEIGHALVAALQSHSAPVQKITIVPRTSGALGYTMQVDEGNHYLMSKVEIENKIATLTGGRAAEEVAFGSVTTGASNDIEQATKLARAMITRYGMSEDFDMVALEIVTNQYLGGDASLACSAETQTNIDRQVVALVKKQHEKAAQLLLQNRGKLDQLAQYLYEKETITGDEFMAMLNEPAAQLPQDVPGTQE